jgi:hypothetical protein
VGFVCSTLELELLAKSLALCLCSLAQRNCLFQVRRRTQIATASAAREGSQVRELALQVLDRCLRSFKSLVRLVLRYSQAVHLSLQRCHLLFSLPSLVRHPASLKLGCLTLQLLLIEFALQSGSLLQLICQLLLCLSSATFMLRADCVAKSRRT